MKTAIELGITQNLFTALIAVRDKLLNGEITAAQYDQTEWPVGANRDTGCIGFWANQIEPKVTGNVVNEPTSLQRLCMGGLWDGDERATPAEGAAAIQQFLDGKAIPWDAVYLARQNATAAKDD